jgi:hypothetical protein
MRADAHVRPKLLTGLRVLLGARGSYPDWELLRCAAGHRSRKFLVVRSLDWTLVQPGDPMRSTRPAALVILLTAVGCAPKPGEAGKHLRSERERDSILGASQLPGARGVRGALGASDSADARNARLDSIANQP